MPGADNNSYVIKICGITTVQDAEDAVSSGATALGFNFYPKSVRYVSTYRAREIARSLPEGVVKVGVFVNASSEELAVVADTVPLDVLQLHGEVPAEVPNVRIWGVKPVDNNV